MKEGHFISAEALSIQEGINLNTLKSLAYKPTEFNYLRFKERNGKLFVRTDFQAPLKEELDELRLKALIIAHNENNLCQELEKLSHGKLKKASLQKYFYRYNFKQMGKAISIIQLLKKYINQNSFFDESELNYE